jgi:hypothetical protein
VGVAQGNARCALHLVSAQAVRAKGDEMRIPQLFPFVLGAGIAIAYWSFVLGLAALWSLLS